MTEQKKNLADVRDSARAVVSIVDELQQSDDRHELNLLLQHLEKAISELNKSYEEVSL
jgi:DNA mismatch repair ATPase MutS